MSDDKNQGDGELFPEGEVTKKPESSTDAVSTTKESQRSEDPGEENKIDLEVEEKPEAKISKQKQVDAWAQKVLDGEADLENLPPKQKWLKPLIEKKLEIEEQVPEITDVIKETLKKEREEAKFEDLKDKLPYMELDRNQKATVESEFKDLVGSGVSKYKALEKALKIAGAKDPKEVEMERLKKNMTLPKDGGYGEVEPGKPKDQDDLQRKMKSMNSQERVQYLEKLRLGQI